MSDNVAPAAYCPQCRWRLATPFCAQCSTRTRHLSTPKGRGVAKPALSRASALRERANDGLVSLTTDTEPAWAATASSKMADQPLPTDGTALHQIHSIRVRAVWTLLAGAVLSAIGVGTLSYANSAGGLVWGGAVLAGGLMIFRAARSLRRLRTRWAIPSVVAILVVVVVVGVEASNAGTSAADHRANDLVGHYLRHSDSTLYRETDLAQQLTAICEIADNMGGGVLVKNVAGDYGITEPAGASHEPPGTPGCAATAPMLDEAQTLINLIHGN